MDVMKKQSSEKRLIDSKALVEHLERMAHIARTTYPNLFHGLFEAAEYVKDFPAIDAVTVVRCRECKYWGDEDGKLQDSDGVLFARCKVHNYLIDGRHTGWCPTENDFCSYGERKEGAD